MTRGDRRMLQSRSLGHDKIPMFLGIDVEPDQYLDVGARGPVSWTGVPAMRRHIRELRTSLEEVTGSPLRVGWYVRMDPQIEAVCGSIDSTADRISDVALSEDGDYLGLHVHATVWDADTACWVSERRDPGSRQEHLKVGLDAFTCRMGEVPLRHRFTNSLNHDPAFAVLAKAGVKVDTTPEPQLGSRWRRGAYQTVTDPPLTVVPENSTSSLGPGPTWRKVARKIRRPLMWWSLSPFRKELSPTECWDEMSLVLTKMRMPYVSLAFRTDAAGSRSDERHRALLDALVTHPLARSLRFADPLELVPTTDATRTSLATNS
jgi:hypothetical protein